MTDDDKNSFRAVLQSFDDYRLATFYECFRPDAGHFERRAIRDEFERRARMDWHREGF